MSNYIDPSVLIITPSALYRVIASYNFFSDLYTYYGVNGCCNRLIDCLCTEAAGRGILVSYGIESQCHEFQCQCVLDDYNFHL